MGVILQDPKYEQVLHCKITNMNRCYITRPYIWIGVTLQDPKYD